tara:strand:+ start:2262 stop:2789 length:528 start_codon:yes stop_codon:yes gene_type:complete
VARLRLGRQACNRPVQTISPPLRGFLANKFCASPGPSRCCGRVAVLPARPPRSGSQQGRDGRDLGTPKGASIMANTGIFTAQNDGFAGNVRTLTLNVKVKFIPNDRSSENAPDYRIQAASGYDIGAAWKKVSQAERPYLSVTLDDPSFPSTIYARLIEEDNGTHNLIWSRSKSMA